MIARRVLFVLAVAALGLGGWFVTRGQGGRASGGAGGAGGADPYLPDVADAAPTGAPVRGTRTPAVDEFFDVAGRFHYRQVATGRFGHEQSVPTRSLEGTVTGTRRTEATAGGVRSTVAATFDLVERVGSAPAAPRRLEMGLSYVEASAGGAVPSSIRWSGPADVLPDLEAFGAAFTERFSLPDRDVRVGEILPLDDVVAIDRPFLEVAWTLFRSEVAEGRRAVLPVVGAVRVEALEPGSDGWPALRLRVAARQAHAATVGPAGKDAVRIDYRAAMEGERVVETEGGAWRAHRITLRRRIRSTARELDYTVETEGAADLTSTRRPR